MAKYGGKFMKKPAAGLTQSQSKGADLPVGLRQQPSAPPRGPAQGLMEQAAAVNGQPPRLGAPPVPITTPVNQVPDIQTGEAALPMAPRGPVERVSQPVPRDFLQGQAPVSREVDLSRETPGLMAMAGARGAAQGQPGFDLGRGPEFPVMGAGKPGSSYGTMTPDHRDQTGQRQQREDEYNAARAAAHEAQWRRENPETYEDVFGREEQDLDAYRDAHRRAEAGPGAGRSEDDIKAAYSDKVFNIITGGADAYIDEDALASDYDALEVWKAKEQEKYGHFLASKGISASGAAAEGWLALDLETERLKSEALAAAKATALQEYLGDLNAIGTQYGNLLSVDAQLALAEATLEGQQETQFFADQTAWKNNMNTFWGTDNYSQKASGYMDKFFADRYAEGMSFAEILKEWNDLEAAGQLPVQISKGGTTVQYYPTIEELIDTGIPTDAAEFASWAEGIKSQYGITHEQIREIMTAAGYEWPNISTYGYGSYVAPEEEE